jgi:hypothetical protein
MSANPLTPRQPRPALSPGQRVLVNLHAAAWIPGTVVSVAHRAIGIDLATSHGTLRRHVRPWLVVPAGALRPVNEIRPGDQIADADGTPRTVATDPWFGPDGTWVITYTTGERAAVPPGTVLRLTGPTPVLSIGGARLGRTTRPRS